MSSLETDLFISYPILDHSLILSILSDYPLEPPKQDLDLIHETLASLSLEAQTYSQSSESPETDSYGSASTGASKDDSTAGSEDVDAVMDYWEKEEERVRVMREEPLTEGMKSKSLNLPPEDQDTTLSPEIKFLHSVFPSLSISELTTHLSSNGESVPKTVDDILSSETISLLEIAELQNQEERGGEEDGRSKHRKKRKKRGGLNANKEGQVTLSLTDVRQGGKDWDLKHGGDNGISALPMSPGGSSPSSPSVDLFASQDLGGASKWTVNESLFMYLSDLLSVPVPRITSLYHRYDNAIPLLILNLIKSLEASRSWDSIQGGDILLDSFMNFKPELKFADAKTYLSVTMGDVSNAMDLVDVVKRFTGNGALDVGLVLLKEQGVARKLTDTNVALLASSSILESRTPLDRINSNQAGWTKTAKERFLEGNKGKETTAGESLQSPFSSQFPSLPSDSLFDDEDSLDFIIREATELREKRNDAYREAARHFQSGAGGPSLKAQGERAIAMIHVEKGRRLDVEMREAAMRAARGVVEQRSRTNPDSIDLHNLTVPQALTIVKESCSRWYASSGSVSPLKIITGVGHHSVNKQAKILPAVENLLNREGWDWRYENGVRNNGVLIVRGTRQRRKPL